MALWKNWASLGAWLLFAASALPETYDLREQPKDGRCFQVRVQMNLNGSFSLDHDGKETTMPLRAEAKHGYVEKVLAHADSVPVKSARVYREALAKITAGNNSFDRKLRSSRNLIVVQRPNDEYLVYSPAGALTREELELTSGHLDSQAVLGLLPQRSVKVNDTWKVDNGTAQILAHFEGLTEHNLSGRLEKVTGDEAHFRVTGTASGIEFGAWVEIKVDAACVFDRKRQALVSIHWKQQDKRDRGPVSPAMTLTSTYLLTRLPIAEPDELAEEALVSVPAGFDVSPVLTQLEFRDDRGRFEFLHDRNWHVVGPRDERVVLRLLDRGEFIAQATIVPLEKSADGKHMSPETFARMTRQSPGWLQEQVIQEGELPSIEKDYWLYRLTATGQLDGLKVLQNFFLVAHDGHQLAVTFTMSHKQAEKLGSRDLALVANVRLPAK
ncbi:MAG: hypothetical protein KatS3mg105_2356 [Gemmatales bacterium]|nr:MAG: hypothetical protein KatS3mg105_2356 [Gemmatales bacterium]